MTPAMRGVRRLYLALWIVWACVWLGFFIWSRLKGPFPTFLRIRDALGVTDGRLVAVIVVVVVPLLAGIIVFGLVWLLRWVYRGFNPAQERPRVWLVDDLRANRDQFQRKHGHNFQLSIFETPDQVLEALRDTTIAGPDALLCDIYFYDTEDRAAEVEKQVREQADQLRQSAQALGADQALKGIDLIRAVNAQFGGAPTFPVYAYTSKGPYLLQDAAFDQLETLGARWLFKGKYGAFTERERIFKDIRDSRQKEWGTRIWRFVVVTGAISAILGAILGVLADRLSTKLFGF